MLFHQHQTAEEWREGGRDEGGQAGMLNTPISLNKLPELGSRAHLYGYGYFYKSVRSAIYLAR